MKTGKFYLHGKNRSTLVLRVQIATAVFLLQVKDTYESRDFLGVSMGTILKIKTGSVTPDGPTRLVLRTSQETSPDTVEIMVQITHETVRFHLINSVVFERKRSINVADIAKITVQLHLSKIRVEGT